VSCAFVGDVASLAPNESPSADLLKHVRGCEVCEPALRTYQKQDRDIRFTYEAMPVPPRREIARSKPFAPWAAITLAAAVLLGAVIVGVGINQFRASQSPQQSLRAIAGEIAGSIDRVGAFSATLSEFTPGSALSGRDWKVVESVEYQDDNHWKRTIHEDSLAPSGQSILTTGSYIAWDGQRLVIYSAVENIYYVREDSPSLRDALGQLSPMRILAPFRRNPLGTTSAASNLPDYLETVCGALPDDMLVGRRTYHFHCFDGDRWFDRESGLLLRSISPTSSAAAEEQRWDVTGLAFEATFPAETFSISIPSGANLVSQGAGTPFPQVPLGPP
jgi:hypothetical protein